MFVRLSVTLLFGLWLGNNSEGRVARVAHFHAAEFCHYAAAWGRHEERERRVSREATSVWLLVPVSLRF